MAWCVWLCPWTALLMILWTHVAFFLQRPDLLVASAFALDLRHECVLAQQRAFVHHFYVLACESDFGDVVSLPSKLVIEQEVLTAQYKERKAESGNQDFGACTLWKVFPCFGLLVVFQDGCPKAIYHVLTMAQYGTCVVSSNGFSHHSKKWDPIVFSKDLSGCV